jgi:hypothetical protein
MSEVKTVPTDGCMTDLDWISQEFPRGVAFAIRVGWHFDGGDASVGKCLEGSNLAPHFFGFFCEHHISDGSGSSSITLLESETQYGLLFHSTNLGCFALTSGDITTKVSVLR